MAKVIISLPDELLETVDKYCSEFNYNRSEFVRKALRDIVMPKNKKDSQDDSR